MPAHHQGPATLSAERGIMLIELLFGMVLLSIGVLAAAQMFPAGTRAQVRDRMLTTGTYYAQDKLEELRSLDSEDAALSVGRHPAGTDTEALGDSGDWQRYYQVTQMAAPMDNLKEIRVIVRWSTRPTRTDSVSAATYVRL